jgi:CRISPR-associated protein Csm5
MTLSPSTSLPRPSVTDTRQVRLTSRILHIGSAVSKLNPFEYIKTPKFVYLPDQDELAKVLQQRGFLNDYIGRIERREDITDLLEDVFGKDWHGIKGESGQPIFPRTLRSVNWAGTAITDLRPMIRNGFGHHYIPGSSIKGAIRTAIAYHLLKHSDRYHVPQTSRISAIESRLRESIGTLRRDAKKADDSFMNELFTNFGLTYKERSVRDQQGPNTDIMRAVLVSDSEPLIEQKIEREGQRPTFRNLSVVTETIVSSRFPDYKAKFRASIYTEMVLNLRTQFTISVDHERLNWFRHNRGMALPFNSVDDLLKICQEFAQEQWTLERNYWFAIINNPDAKDRNLIRNLDFDFIRDIYKSKICPYTLRLGWGSGMMGTTINSLMNKDLASQIRDACASPSNKAPGFEAPKSRRTIMNSKGEIRYVPGWVKLEVL